MAGEKEIRSKIESIKSTQKITKAMEMVAASKMRRARDRMEASRPYAKKMRDAIGHVAQACVEYRHPYLSERETVKGVGFIVISTDRGLCGGLNINAFKAGTAAMKEWVDQNIPVKITTLGAKAAGFYRRTGNVVSEAAHFGDTPHVDELIGAIKVMLDAYEGEEIDRLFMVENEFVSTMSQSPKITQLLPAVAAADAEAEGQWDYIYEPEAAPVLDLMLKRYIESQVYQAVTENVACEMSARMVAMKSASDNASTLIDDLQLVYNKARQAAITQELSEIVSGAAAV